MVVLDELACSLGMKVIIELPTNTHVHRLEPNCESHGPVPVGMDMLRLETLFRASSRRFSGPGEGDFQGSLH